MDRRDRSAGSTRSVLRSLDHTAFWVLDKESKYSNLEGFLRWQLN